ncbi:MAG: sulfite exporter TauE/SafE family protein [Microscillaceae bacterium]
MSSEWFMLSFVLFLSIAGLYSTVGHAGASGYLALMGLLSFAPATIKPTSLILNIAVALLASVRFIRAGYFDKSLFFTFIGTALPMAFLGGYLSLNPLVFKYLAGIFLLVSSFLLLARPAFAKIAPEGVKKSHFVVKMSLGAVIGFVSGLIGVGGGIFLSPVMIMAGWTSVKNASGVSALFILCNSVAGLSGHWAGVQTLDPYTGYWLLAVGLGGSLGTYLGTLGLGNRAILQFLATVLLLAGLKFIFI